MISSVDELSAAAGEILSSFEDERIFAFYGKMGAGKTTLIKYFCDILGVTDKTSSPTFAIVNEYNSLEDELIYHFDFYRIEKISEVLDIGYEEYLYSGNYCFMEWPEKISKLLPDKFVYVLIEYGISETEREISFGKNTSSEFSDHGLIAE